MGAISKRAKKIRTASDFDLIRIAAELRAPKVSAGFYSWDLDAIRAARDAQSVGKFQLAARLAEATRTDYAIFASFLNRLAPQRGLPVHLVPPNETARAKRVLDEASALFGARGIGIHPDTLSDVDGTLANHGVAFGFNIVTPREDGTRVDFELKSWPIEFVRWDPIRREYRTQVDGFTEEPISHGDGRWVIFQQHQHEPWKHGAILAAAMLWADHAFGVRDRAKASTAHGNAKVVGTLPEGISLQDAEGHLSQEGQAFLELLRAIASADVPVGIKPSGSTLDYIVNNSTAWQIFKEIIDSGDKAADRIYLGTPVSATTAGGDAVGFLFGVRNDIVEGSIRAIERGIRTGVIEPWTALNFGDSTLAPDRVYLMPDADEDARRKSLADRNTAFYTTVQAARANGFTVQQDYVNSLAEDFGITPPTLSGAPVAPTVPAAPPAPAAPPDSPPKQDPQAHNPAPGPAAQAPTKAAAHLRPVAPVARLYSPDQPRADDGKFGEGPGSGGGGGGDHKPAGGGGAPANLDNPADHRRVLAHSVDLSREAVHYHVKEAHQHVAKAQGEMNDAVSSGRAYSAELRRTADAMEKEKGPKRVVSTLRQSADRMDKHLDKFEQDRPDITISKYATPSDEAKLEVAHSKMQNLTEHVLDADRSSDVLNHPKLTDEQASRHLDEVDSPLAKARDKFHTQSQNATDSINSASEAVTHANNWRDALLISKDKLKKHDAAQQHSAAS